MLDLIPLPYIMYKTNKAKQKKVAMSRSTQEEDDITAEFGMMFGILMVVYLIMMVGFLYIWYRNFVYVFKCVPKSSRIIHLLLAFFFNFIYFIYRLIAGGKCKY